jgi:hypothetical protein
VRLMAASGRREWRRNCRASAFVRAADERKRHLQGALQRIAIHSGERRRPFDVSFDCRRTMIVSIEGNGKRSERHPGDHAEQCDRGESHEASGIVFLRARFCMGIQPSLTRSRHHHDRMNCARLLQPGPPALRENEAMLLADRISPTAATAPVRPVVKHVRDHAVGYARPAGVSSRVAPPRARRAVDSTGQYPDEARRVDERG